MGTRFQAHVQWGLSNFLRSFWCMQLFADNVVEQGLGVDSLVRDVESCVETDGKFVQIL